MKTCTETDLTLRTWTGTRPTPKDASPIRQLISLFDVEARRCGEEEGYCWWMGASKT